MNQKFAVVLFALVVCPGVAAPVQALNNVRVPAQQKALTDILSKYNDLDDGAPNEIQKDRLESEFRKAFCAAIPKGNVYGWVGDVTTIDNHTPSKGISLSLMVSTQDLRSGDLGVELSLSNDSDSDEYAKPHVETIIPVGSPLYRVVSTLRSGDTVIFSGTFVPYVSPQACYQNDTTDFALIRFSTIWKVGWGIAF